MRKLLSGVLAVLAAVSLSFALSGCGPEEEVHNNNNNNNNNNNKQTEVSVSGVSLDQTSVSIEIGESVTLAAKVSPDKATAKNTAWSSSNTNVATVTNGKITAVSEGTSTITITVDGKTATCAVTVVKGGFPEGKLPASNEIWYITTDKKPLQKVQNQGTNTLQSNTYENGMGVLKFSSPITDLSYITNDYDQDNRVKELLLPDSIERIVNGVFLEYRNLKELRIPASLKEVFRGAFTIRTAPLERFTGSNVSDDGHCLVINKELVGLACAGMSSYELPSGISKIGDESCAFTTLKSLTLSSEVTSIGRGPFSESSLESITIPASVTSMDSYAFLYCHELKNLLGDSPFISQDRKFIFIPNGYSPNLLAFFAGKDDTSYEIPEGVNCIGNYSFANCVKLKSLTLPESLNRVESAYAFENCDNLEALYGFHTTEDHKGFVNDQHSLQFLVPKIDDDYVVPDDVTSIGRMVFQFRPTLRSVTMGDQVTSIGDYAFQYCRSLKTVTLSANLGSFGLNPFMGSSALEAVYFRSVVPPSYSDSQLSEASALKFYVPDLAINLYKSSYDWKDYWDILEPYQYSDLPEPEFYLSSDYSKEGEVTVYQTATEGNGIDVVFMGDAYSDRQVESGLYMNDLKATAEAFFSIEPYKSFRGLFNIYFVTTVSTTEYYKHGGRSLGTYRMPTGTGMGGNDSKCFEMALKAVEDESRMNEVLVVVCGNQNLDDEYVYLNATCYMYDPDDWGGHDYANGPAVAYFIKTDKTFERSGMVACHEAGGHGFAKLEDEYFVTESSINWDKKQHITERVPYGWYSNIDLTSDPASVKWANFLSDERYQYDGLGIFEGGATYRYGVWRPTETSIMDSNTGGFNAPSRYTIWYRIHKLAYGDSWNGTYEDFVAYDVINRKTAENADNSGRSSSKARARMVERREQSAPVSTGLTWREAIK